MLWLKLMILGSISTLSLPTPWPRLRTQYWFSTSSLPYFSEIYSEWYVFDDTLGKCLKILPSNILSLFTEVSLAYFIMGDGYWDKDQKTMILCTENFTEVEVQTLIDVIYSKLGLVATKKARRLQPDDKLCWRIRFSGKSDNIKRLRQLVSPYMHHSMLYKLGV